MRLHGFKKKGEVFPLPVLFIEARLGSNANLPLTAEGAIGGHCLTVHLSNGSYIPSSTWVTAKTQGDTTPQVPNTVSSTQSPFPQTKAPVLAREF